MIQTQMCQAFIDMYHRIRDGSPALPTTEEVLGEAAIHPGIMPYLNLWHPQEGDCGIGIFAPAWLQWLEVVSAPRLLSQLISPECANLKSVAFLKAASRGFGFHEIGDFSLPGRKSFFVETVSLPAQRDGAVYNMFNFAIPILSSAIQTSTSQPALIHRWLDLGSGVPSEPPASTLSLAA